MHTNVKTYTHVHTHTHINTDTHTHTHTHTHIHHKHTHTHRHTKTLMTLIKSHKRAHTHAHTHTHTHTHTHIILPFSNSPPTLQHKKGGGLRDKPGKSPDYYHTCYALSGPPPAPHSSHLLLPSLQSTVFCTHGSW
jgi:hypothetical protein